jgi:hypothetical protein
MERKKLFIIFGMLTFSMTFYSFAKTSASGDAHSEDLKVRIEGTEKSAEVDKGKGLDIADANSEREEDKSKSKWFSLPYYDNSKLNFGDGFLNPGRGYFSTKTYIYNQRIIKFAKSLYNSDADLSQDGTDIVTLLTMSKDFYLDITSLNLCLRLITNKLKSYEIIDYTVLEQVIKPLPRLLDMYLDRRNIEEYLHLTALSDLERNIESTVDDNIEVSSDKRNIFDPDKFSIKLTEDVNALVRESFEIQREEAEKRDLSEKLRQCVVNFLHVLLNRVLWDENNYEGIWPSFLSIADQLHVLGVKGIITDQDDLDDLWDTLSRRFAWYLDFRGSVLPFEFYKQIEEELNNHVVTFLEIDEVDGIITRKEILMDALLQAKAKVIAYEQKGILTDQLDNA